jgi:hypothetical protein
MPTISGSRRRGRSRGLGAIPHQRYAFASDEEGAAMIFGWGKKGQESAARVGIEPNSIPTVKFDQSRLTKTVKQDLRENIEAISDIRPADRRKVYEIVIRAKMIDLGLITRELQQLPGMTRRRSAEIARLLSRKADALMRIEDQIRLGIEESIWRYGGPCGDAEQDAAHKAANGKKYSPRVGLLVNGRMTFPGRDDQCGCISRPGMPEMEE